MNGDSDRQVIQCNYMRPTPTAAVGARAYVTLVNPGNGHDRITVRVFSRGKRWVEKWEDICRLGNFRLKTIPPEHPMYGDAFAPPNYLDQLVRAATEAAA
ncbi:hypothetical protein [Catenuloplanes japonicus]|uniref:hypothetical protein n=1 Tax=Catenuloplanes japonicus TaxID=33876 RepID=UPI0012FC37CA|nr:hypothetical protein [Catenuloplanes japonicus]